MERALGNKDLNRNHKAGGDGIKLAKRNRLNDEIDDLNVRLIDAEGVNMGVMSATDARKFALERELDLVELVPNATPPVCRVMDYGKFRFEQRKKAQQARKKQKRTQVKEVKFRPGTDTMDYETKLRNLVRFLRDGDKTKVVLRFRGREMTHRELGMRMLHRVRADLAEHAVVEQQPKSEGRQIVMVMAPKKQTAAKPGLAAPE